MFRQGQLAVHGLAILLGRNEAGISNRGKIFLHHAVLCKVASLVCLPLFLRIHSNDPILPTKVRRAKIRFKMRTLKQGREILL